MNKIIKYIIPVFTALVFSACEKDTEDLSRITYYNDIELVGEENYVIEEGETYTEPGALAFEADVDVTDAIVITENVDTSTPGYYEVSYYIENKDGFGKTITRNVFVLPADRKISDEYAGSYTGENTAGSFAAACTITHLGDGLYYCSDLIGARYNIGFGYGAAYQIPGYFYITADGTSYEALLTSSPWGPWEIVNQSLNGTTFTHDIKQGTFSTPVELIKE